MSTTVTFLFWNIRQAQGTRFYESLRQLSLGNIDVVLFAEPPQDDRPLLAALNGSSKCVFYRVPSISRRLMLFSRFSINQWNDRFSDGTSDRMIVQELSVNQCNPILLVGAHLKPPNNLSNEDRADWVRMLVPDIRRVEKDAKHSRTIVVGDLNMNPFDVGMVSTTALHALMSRSLVASVLRMKSRREHLPFYNPMWSLMGDHPINHRSVQDRPAGTYFYPNVQALAGHFWQMFDQVLLRPDLMGTITNLKILNSDGRVKLVTKSGRPRRSMFSDHLPLLFTLDLSKGNK